MKWTSHTVLLLFCVLNSYTDVPKTYKVSVNNLQDAFFTDV